VTSAGPRVVRRYVLPLKYRAIDSKAETVRIQTVFSVISKLAPGYFPATVRNFAHVKSSSTQLSFR